MAYTKDLAVGDVFKIIRGWSDANRKYSVGVLIRIDRVDTANKSYAYVTTLDDNKSDPLVWYLNQDYFEFHEQQLPLTSEELDRAVSFPAMDELGKFLNL